MSIDWTTNSLKHFVVYFSSQYYTLSTSLNDMAAYMQLSDHIYYKILYSVEPELEEAREILKKIERRQIYKCIGSYKLKNSNQMTKVIL